MTTLKTKLEETKIAATDKVNEAKVKTQDKLHEAQEEASQALAQAQDTLHQKQTVANGRFTQAKGIAKEKLGQLTHNNALQRAGKVDQAKGYLQAAYGHSWPVRHKGTVMAATALVALLTYLLTRKNAVAS